MVRGQGHVVRGQGHVVRGQGHVVRGQGHVGPGSLVSLWERWVVVKKTLGVMYPRLCVTLETTTVFTLVMRGRLFDVGVKT